MLYVTIFGSSTSQSSVEPGSSSVRRRYSSWVQPAHAPICLPDSSSGFVTAESAATKKLAGVE